MFCLLLFDRLDVAEIQRRLTLSQDRQTKEKDRREVDHGCSDVVVWDEYVFDHGLVDAVGVSKVLPEALGIFVEPVASITLDHFTAAGKMNEMIVTLGTPVRSKGFTTCQTLAGTIRQLDHFVERN